MKFVLVAFLLAIIGANGAPHSITPETSGGGDIKGHREITYVFGGSGGLPVNGVSTSSLTESGGQSHGAVTGSTGTVTGLTESEKNPFEGNRGVETGKIIIRVSQLFQRNSSLSISGLSKTMSQSDSIQSILRQLNKILSRLIATLTNGGADPELSGVISFIEMAITQTTALNKGGDEADGALSNLLILVQMIVLDIGQITGGNDEADFELEFIGMSLESALEHLTKEILVTCKGLIGKGAKGKDSNGLLEIVETLLGALNGNGGTGAPNGRNGFGNGDLIGIVLNIIESISSTPSLNGLLKSLLGSKSPVEDLLKTLLDILSKLTSQIKSLPPQNGPSNGLLAELLQIIEETVTQLNAMLQANAKGSTGQSQQLSGLIASIEEIIIRLTEITEETQGFGILKPIVNELGSTLQGLIKRILVSLKSLIGEGAKGKDSIELLEILNSLLGVINGNNGIGDILGKRNVFSTLISLLGPKSSLNQVLKSLGIQLSSDDLLKTLLNILSKLVSQIKSSTAQNGSSKGALSGLLTLVEETISQVNDLLQVSAKGGKVQPQKMNELLISIVKIVFSLTNINDGAGGSGVLKTLVKELGSNLQGLVKQILVSLKVLLGNANGNKNGDLVSVLLKIVNGLISRLGISSGSDDILGGLLAPVTDILDGLDGDKDGSLLGGIVGGKGSLLDGVVGLLDGDNSINRQMMDGNLIDNDNADKNANINGNSDD